jgi:hypothetical protein
LPVIIVLLVEFPTTIVLELAIKPLDVAIAFTRNCIDFVAVVLAVKFEATVKIVVISELSVFE